MARCSKNLPLHLVMELMRGAAVVHETAILPEMRNKPTKRQNETNIRIELVSERCLKGLN